MSEEPRTIEDIKGDITAVQNGGYPWGSYDDVTRFAAQCHRDRVWLALEHACLSAALAAAEVTRDRAMSDFDALALEYHKLSSHLQQSHAREAVLSEALNEPFSAGARVVNCVVHTGAFTERPRNCENCATDIRNQLALAIRVNEFLNNKVDAAKNALSTLPHQASAMIEVVAKATRVARWDAHKVLNVDSAGRALSFANDLDELKAALSTLNSQERQQ